MAEKRRRFWGRVDMANDWTAKVKSINDPRVTLRQAAHEVIAAGLGDGLSEITIQKYISDYRDEWGINDKPQQAKVLLERIRLLTEADEPIDAVEKIKALLRGWT